MFILSKFGTASSEEEPIKPSREVLIGTNFLAVEHIASVNIWKDDSLLLEAQLKLL